MPLQESSVYHCSFKRFVIRNGIDLASDVHVRHMCLGPIASTKAAHMCLPARVTQRQGNFSSYPSIVKGATVFIIPWRW